MKTNKYIIVALVLVVSMLSVNCSNNSDSIDYSGTYVQKDQMARPAINTVFIAAGAPKDAFNGTIPSQMAAAYQSVFQARLIALTTPVGVYSTNALGQNAAQFTGLLATDVLNVKTSGTTTFFDGVPAHTLSGRALADDVIDVELLLIFGGPTGGDNPTLTSDNVDTNDKPFLTSFPYLAAAW